MTKLAQKRPLKIYRASAGSGKTFTLAVEYIKLLIENPMAYANILAVTFTNKATAEMKNRILSQLYGLSKQLDSSKDYMAQIRKDPVTGKYDENTISQRAQMALQNIVHDYSRFRIETIDSFFQSVLMELAHELKLSANLRVDLNDEEVLQKAVEEIIYNLKPNSRIFEWIFWFIRQKIDEGNNWVVKENISKFGSNIFNETFLENRKALEATLADDKALSNYRDKMKQIVKDAKEDIQQAGLDFIALCQDNGLEEKDFVGKSKGPYPFIKQISEGAEKEWNKTLDKTLKGEKEWIKNGDSELCEQFTKLLDRIYKNIIRKNSALASGQHITNLGLLNDIDVTVRQLNNDANRFLLSDTAHFLNEMIGESDVPFLYEKIGNKFTHIMIDEFQDTSRLQWLNFLPLLCNALATDSTCLIVGDVKQSIYRWRNSDWSILNNIDDTPELRGKMENIPLNTNYRSAERIINFNNLLFVKLIEVLNNNYQYNHNGAPFSDLKSAYNDIRQRPNDKHKGKGYVRFYKKEGEEIDILESVLDTIHELKDKGVKENQIAILLRKKNEIAKICNYLAEHDSSIKTMSDEAFQLKSSPAVRVIIYALRLIANPNDSLSKKSLAVCYQQIENPDNINKVYTADDDALEEMLPEGFTALIPTLSLMSITEAAEHIYMMFGLERIEGQSAYLFSFHDKVVDYMRDNPSDVPNFLRAWDEGIGEKTIPNDAATGIRLMTIHKSKGLEFHTVLMPFCNWNFKNDDMLWVMPEEEDFNELKVVPVSNKKILIQSIYSKDYDQELLRIWVDNSNLLYVGFTRAENNLFIWTKENKKNTTNSVTASKILNTCLSSGFNDKGTENNTIDVTMMDEDGNLIEETITDVASLFSVNEAGYKEYGELVGAQEVTEKSNEKATKEEENVLKTTPQTMKCDFVYHEHEACFLQSNESRRFIAGEDEETDDKYINEGLLFHAILENINATDELHNVINKFDAMGHFYSQDYRMSVERELEKAFQNTQAAEWFAPDWKVFKECSILYTDNRGKCHTKRPDRVITNGEETIVIDYKTGQQNDKHMKQVEDYMTLLKKMGYKGIKGYVWYIRRNDIVPCRIKDE